ncbi:MAG: hypothetical protein H0W39_06325 [Sphingomonas sp.]|nr:hypothetical protein [Sphingomonas sp.]
MSQDGTSPAPAIVAGLIFVLAVTGVIYLLASSSKEVMLAVLTAAISVASLLYTQNKISKREVAARQFAQKAKAYESIISTIGELFKTTKGWAKKTDEEELAKELFDIQSQLMVWAGPDVLKAWNELKTDKPAPQTFAVVERLLRALRGELGHTNDNELGPWGLMKVYLRHEDHDQLPNMPD